MYFAAQSCPSGYYLYNSLACMPCATGTYGTGGWVGSVCSACEPGTYANTTGNATVRFARKLLWNKNNTNYRNQSLARCRTQAVHKTAIQWTFLFTCSVRSVPSLNKNRLFDQRIQQSDGLKRPIYITGTVFHMDFISGKISIDIPYSLHTFNKQMILAAPMANIPTNWHFKPKIYIF